ncbi:2Fe-2S iron-sulfur cluster binding domain-containing protein [Sinimarinibacterium sp. CAU 1509]|uniref:FAD-binding oxidoreductase n=1 Tax=Sinimarinibacterium sp. CAU 1509 TaxID=2562283 RepID=UPI0010AD2F10|nr:FAD-binding oxidoreductase [Sinimarinibacterium sp. CAU 1509]TJY59540.1 2Fe-2S iron-sulfur cluster binding domain-containing protein [Sinimarinibacterium sp. CAU 1509]
MLHRVTVRYSDGTEKLLNMSEEQTILDAAEASGVPIVNECQSGLCGTCVGNCTSGSYELGRTEGLSEQERDARKILTCQARVRSDCVVELEYPANANAARLVAGEAIVQSVEIVSDSTAILRIDASSLGEKLNYHPGQFAQLMVPGTSLWRSYSYAHVANDENSLEFIVRLLPEGAMSDYLRTRARAGDRIQLRGSKGRFYLRDVTRPVVLMAGGTGLSAILAIADHLTRHECAQPVRLYYGVTRYDDLCKIEALKALSESCATLDVRIIVSEPDTRWTGPTGLITDLLDERDLNDGDVDVYLCGPPAMVEATRRWFDAHRLHNLALYYEKFVPTGTGTAAGLPPRLAAKTLDYGDLRKRGKGTAIVVGGSIIGMSTAKVLLQKFERVIVLEKDSGHHRMEGRPGVAQGWHLHHLLIAGQRMLETVFPGIIDDMVRAGAFKVDMAEQYRLYMAGAWKKVCKSGIEIVCAGRPLLEWCVRRRLDDEARIEFRYDTEVHDLIYDKESNRVLGVGASIDGQLQPIPAEFVVDASGKNTPVPKILERIGIGAPEAERDSINCFYSTMRHAVPPERQWQDKVMVICYAYRPHQEHYTAQYYTDSSRTTLSTSLVAYNCYSPPRNDEEFREFAKLMPNSEVAHNLEGLKAISPVYNFRYPDMVRLHYERMKRLPAGLVVVGDAYASADPVSGAGMTKGLLELSELRALLQSDDFGSEAFVHRYNRKIGKIGDLVWFVVREQNLRYPWIHHVDSKRPWYFGGLTWYMDRLTELSHDDMDIYRQLLSVVHFVSPPGSLMTPRVAAKVVGKWLGTKLRFKRTMIDRNFRDGRNGQYDTPAPGLPPHHT